MQSPGSSSPDPFKNFYNDLYESLPSVGARRGREAEAEQDPALKDPRMEPEGVIGRIRRVAPHMLVGAPRPNPLENLRVGRQVGQRAPREPLGALDDANLQDPRMEQGRVAARVRRVAPHMPVDAPRPDPLENLREGRQVGGKGERPHPAAEQPRELKAVRTQEPEMEPPPPAPRDPTDRSRKGKRERSGKQEADQRHRTALKGGRLASTMQRSKTQGSSSFPLLEMKDPIDLFHPTAAGLLVCDLGGSVNLCDLASGEVLAQHRGHQAFSFAVTPTHLVTARNDCKIVVTQLEGWKQEATLYEFRHMPLSLAAHGTCVVSGGMTGCVQVWDVERKSQVRTLKGHTKRVMAVAMTEQTIVSGSWDHTICFWDRGSGKQLTKIYPSKAKWESGRLPKLNRQGHTGKITCIATNGELVAIGSKDSRISVWTPQGQFVAACRGHRHSVSAVTFWENRVVSVDTSGRMIIWEAATGELLKGIKLQEGTKPAHLAVHGDRLYFDAGSTLRVRILKDLES